jgi:hypothetical protein
VSSAQVTVTSTATALDQSTAGARSLLVRNRGAVAVYLGGSGVTTANGFQLDTGESVSVDILGFGGGLYGIVASSTARVDVLQAGLQ